MAKSFILDPLWITKGSFLDAEYFTYVLLDASMKYKKEIEDGKIDRFSEVLFHSLNLNNLAVNGTVFTSKYKSVWNDPKLIQIREDLKKLYNLSPDTAEIFRNANFVFLNILLDYTDIHLDILESLRLFYMNQKIHTEKEVFIVTNRAGTKKYTIWRLSEDSKKNFGFSFSKIRSIKVESIKDNVLKEELEKLEDPKLEKMSGRKNVFFAIADQEIDEKLVADTVKDLILINKGLAREHKFEPTLIEQLYGLMWVEKIMPFTLDQWKFENVKDV
jgi:hypothetical protein